MNRRGHDPEAIAAMQGVALGTVKASIELVEEHRALASNEMLDMRITEMALELMDKNQKVLNEAMSATRDVPVGRSGKVKKAPDWKTRLAALTTQRELIETTRPKTPGMVLQQQFNNGVPGSGFAPGRSFEDQVRAIRERRGLRNDDNVVEADFEDATDTQTAEEELADIGVDIGDDEEGEDG